MKPRTEYILTFTLKTKKDIEDKVFLSGMKLENSIKELKKYQKKYPLYDIKLFKTVYKEVKIEK